MSTVVISATSVPAPTGRSSLWKSLFAQVLAALLLGIVLGIATPGFAIELKILSDAFLKLIGMVVAPIVFCVVVHGIAGAGRSQESWPCRRQGARVFRGYDNHRPGTWHRARFRV